MALSFDREEAKSNAQTSLNCRRSHWGKRKDVRGKGKGTPDRKVCYFTKTRLWTNRLSDWRRMVILIHTRQSK